MRHFRNQQRLFAPNDWYQRDIIYNHGDVLHWFFRFSKTMDNFRADVIREMKGGEEMDDARLRAIVLEEIAAFEAERAALPASDWAKAKIEIARTAGITDGTRPQSYATRQEVALMVNAVTNK